MFEFLNPWKVPLGPAQVSLWLVLGIVGAAIPLIIHLSRSKRTKKMRFSTTRFFTDQFLRSYRMSRLKELLLLACRMLACALLALALSQPLILPKGKGFFSGPGSGARAVVLVVDNSASMGYVENGESQLDRAKKVARELVEGLQPGDSATVILAGRRENGAEMLFPEPTTARADVLAAINSLQPQTLSTDIAGALARAEAVHFPDSAQSREVYVLSDLQDSDLGAIEGEQTKASSDLLYFFVQFRPKSVSNAAVTAIQYEVARPMVGVPFSLQPHVVVQGDRLSDIVVRLYVDGKKVSERRLEKLQNGQWSAPRFYHTFMTGGWHSGYVEVVDENLTLDNRRYFALEVLDAIKVLAINGAPSQVERLDELFFLKRALNPDGQSPIQVESRAPAELLGIDLAKYPLVILANVETVSVPAVENVEKYVDQGGSLLVFLGDKVDANFYNENFNAANRLHGGLLPARLRAVQKDPKGTEDFTRIGDIAYWHFVLSAFQDPRFGDLSSITFQALWATDPVADTDVLLKAQNGSPLLCERGFGKGRVLLFTSTCDRDWTNFPARVPYLPFVHRLVSYLALKQAGKQTFYATGDLIPIPVAATEGMPQTLVKLPGDKLGNVTATSDPERPLVFEDTAAAGIYMLNPDQDKKTQFFAVNLPSAESKLTYLDEDLPADVPRQEAMEALLKERLPNRPMLSFLSDPGKAADASLSARRGTRLWDTVLWVVLLLALFEPLLANWISVRHYAKPKELGELPVSRTTSRGERTPEAQEVRS
jgi:hypothetical protein